MRAESLTPAMRRPDPLEPPAHAAPSEGHASQNLGYPGLSRARDRTCPQSPPADALGTAPAPQPG